MATGRSAVSSSSAARSMDEGADVPHEVDLLEGLAVLHGRRHLADERHERRRVLLGGVQRDRHVGAADAARRLADAGRPEALA
jgi:hypothetical protein